MTSHPRRRTLPPLADRLVRTRLLAWSYPEAAVGVNEGVRGSKPQSRGLSRDVELWTRGSYRDLERAVDRLRQVNRMTYRRFWEHYIGQWEPFPKALPALTGLSFVADLMPAFVYVPADIAAGVGYLASEAERWERGFTDSKPLRGLESSGRVVESAAVGLAMPADGLSG